VVLRFSVRQHYSNADADADADAHSDADTDTDTHADTDTDADTHPHTDLFIPDLDRRSELQLRHRGEVPS
jgi:hypothetical protein